MCVSVKWKAKKCIHLDVCVVTSGPALMMTADVACT